MGTAENTARSATRGGRTTGRGMARSTGRATTGRVSTGRVSTGRGYGRTTARGMGRGRPTTAATGGLGGMLSGLLRRR